MWLGGNEDTDTGMGWDGMTPQRSSDKKLGNVSWMGKLSLSTLVSHVVIRRWDRVGLYLPMETSRGMMFRCDEIALPKEPQNSHSCAPMRAHRVNRGGWTGVAGKSPGADLGCLEKRPQLKKHGMFSLKHTFTIEACKHAAKGADTCHVMSRVVRR